MFKQSCLQQKPVMKMDELKKHKFVRCWIIKTITEDLIWATAE
ncbi:hypothetical protein OAK75_08135 [Bacteriovoracales bacterium]|nr:hypothetical protein [Bacteriovoracales bacterium]